MHKRTGKHFDSFDSFIEEIKTTAMDTENEKTYSVIDNLSVRSQKSKNVQPNRAQQCFGAIKRIEYVLLHLPFLTSVNGFGLTTFTSILFLPRFITQIFLYPVFRLVFGTLYPAYASYKAVRNKDVKDYVSIAKFRNIIFYSYFI